MTRSIHRKPALALGALAIVAGALGLTGAPAHADHTASTTAIATANARVVAVGIPGAGPISAIGAFLPGGPIHDKPEFAAFTQPGKVLDPARILVGSRSNFGAPTANSGEREGALLSIDTVGDTLVVPADFAAADGQATALAGRVQLFSAHSPAFLNGINTPGAVTANYTGVSNPLGLSINNAFGRIWPANAPTGLHGIGTSSILDPNGVPLAGAPNQTTGGVYAGALTGRQPTQVIAGALNVGAVGTAFLGKSPDGSGKAVFCVVLADGSIVQEHTAKALDGLAPQGTIAPLLGRRWEGDHHAGVDPRVGVILNYTPTQILYVSEPFHDAIAAIELTNDGTVIRSGSVRRIRSRALDQPIDLAPVSVETENTTWASNTTMEETSDFYVANRGNNTIVRMKQDGTVVAVRRVVGPDGKPLGEARLNGIATSPDGTRIWVTVAGHFPQRGGSGAVLEIAAF